MPKYRVDTDNGSYMVETEEPPAIAAIPAPPATPKQDPGVGQGLWDSTIGGLYNTAKHYGWDQPSEDAEAIGNQIKSGNYGDAALTAAKSFPGVAIAKDMAGASIDNAKQAYQAAKGGNYADAAIHAVGAVPVFGPGIAEAAENIKNPETREYGIGQSVGTALSFLAPEVARVGLKAAKGAAHVGSEVVGHTTGVGAPVMREALNTANPDAIIAPMRGQLSDQEVLGHFQDALQNVKDARSAEYQAALKTQPPVPDLDITPIRQTADAMLQRFNIKKVATPQGGTDLDFSRSTIRDAAAQNEVRSIVNDISGWGSQPGDLQPAGVDTLKRRIDDTYSPSSSARAIVQSVKKSSSDLLNSQVQGYQKMTSGYAKASDFINNLRDLSIDSKNPGTAIRKLSTALKQNNNYRQVLVDALNQYSGKDLKGELAGLRLSNMAPRGIEGPLTGAGLLMSIATGIVHPAGALALAMSSPRIMGELMIAMNRAKPALRSLNNVPRLPTATAASIGAASPGNDAAQEQNKPEWSIPNEGKPDTPLAGAQVGEGTIIRHRIDPSNRLIFKQGMWQPLH